MSAAQDRRLTKYCQKRHVYRSKGGGSFYGKARGQEVRVSDHPIEASKWEYHPEGRIDGVIYITAPRSRFVEIWGYLLRGVELDDKGYPLS